MRYLAALLVLGVGVAWANQTLLDGCETRLNYSERLVAATPYGGIQAAAKVEGLLTDTVVLTRTTLWGDKVQPGSHSLAALTGAIRNYIQYCHVSQYYNKSHGTTFEGALFPKDATAAKKEIQTYISYLKKESSFLNEPAITDLYGAAPFTLYNQTPPNLGWPSGITWLPQLDLFYVEWMSGWFIGAMRMGNVDATHQVLAWRRVASNSKEPMLADGWYDVEATSETYVVRYTLVLDGRTIPLLPTQLSLQVGMMELVENMHNKIAVETSLVNSIPRNKYRGELDQCYP